MTIEKGVPNLTGLFSLQNVTPIHVAPAVWLGLHWKGLRGEAVVAGMLSGTQQCTEIQWALPGFWTLLLLLWWWHCATPAPGVQLPSLWCAAVAVTVHLYLLVHIWWSRLPVASIATCQPVERRHTRCRHRQHLIPSDPDNPCDSGDHTGVKLTCTRRAALQICYADSCASHAAARRL